MKTIQSNSNAISGLSTTKVVINSRSFSVSSDSTSDSYSQKSNTGLIIGLVVGLVGAALLIALTIFISRKYVKRYQHRRLFNDTEMNDQGDTSTKVTDQNNSTNIQTVTPVSEIPSNNRLHSPLNSEPARIPSAALSITTLDVAKENQLPPVELIRFD